MEANHQILSGSTTLVLPGWQDSDRLHWQTLWEKKFGWKRVVQKDWNTPRKIDWTAKIVESIAKEKTPPVLVCHSLGCAALAHSLQVKPDLQIKAAFIVSPVDFDVPGTPAEILDFRPVPLQPLPFPSLVVASSTDPFCALSQAERFASKWGSSFANVGDRHHIGSLANLGEWPEGQTLLANFLRRQEMATLSPDK